MRILLVEDDVTAAKGLVLMLASGGAITEMVDSGVEALELVRHYEYDAVILDLMLPDMDGYEVARRMRASKIEVPIVMLSGLAKAEAKVKGFGLGADDYITKPFDRAELLARLHAVTRRSKGHAQPVLRVGPLQLNLDSKDVVVNGKPVHLTGKEYGILELLLLRKGTVLSKETFLNHLYGGLDEPEIKIIDVFVCKLRKKLSVGGAGDLITTIWGRGYMIRDLPNEDRPSVYMSAHPEAIAQAA
jgi:two-component system cell cycle response regulator CtrA